MNEYKQNIVILLNNILFRYDIVENERQDF